MHELTVARRIVEACAERAGETRVLRVTLEVGTLTCVMPEALRFCYGVATRATLLEGSELEVLACPGRSRCRQCGREVTMFDLLAACDCGSVDLDPPSGGDELRIRSMEIEEMS
ncbi:hydrogenase maturation nickel metallochaperone HypA [Halomonas organivorans]